MAKSDEINQGKSGERDNVLVKSDNTKMWFKQVYCSKYIYKSTSNELQKLSHVRDSEHALVIRNREPQERQKTIYIEL